jgi:hypothetical protein
VHDIFNAIGAARNHKESGGDQRPQPEADAFLSLGGNAEGGSS